MFRTRKLQARTAEAWCSGRGHYRPIRPKPGVPGRGHYRTERPRPGVPDGDITGQNGRGLVFRTETLQARTAEGWCSRTGTLQDRTAEAWCSRKGTLQTLAAEAWCSRTASDGLTPSAFDPSLEYPTDNVVLFWHPGPIFRIGRLRRLSSTACIILGRTSL